MTSDHQLMQAIAQRQNAPEAANPGVVFARAAATRETDPLSDPWSRLFVGKTPEG